MGFFQLYVILGLFIQDCLNNFDILGFIEVMFQLSYYVWLFENVQYLWSVVLIGFYRLSILKVVSSGVDSCFSFVCRDSGSYCW